jgi:threonyl-tRNA synthetase
MKNPFKKEHTIDTVRHTLAHLLAATVLELYPGSENSIGPAIENGFYQDFEIQGTVSDDDLPKIEKRMKELLKTWTHFTRQEVTLEEVRKIFKHNKYKIELAKDFTKEGKQLTFHNAPKFIDLCRGGHVENPSTDIKPDIFTLTHVAGAYWRGDEKKKMLTRIYGLAFETKKELEEHLIQLEEAKKRDHRKLGRELNLFTFSELVGPGLPLYLPKGNVVKTELERFIMEEKKKLGYQFVHIPHIAKTALYKKSGHLGKYDAMMPIMKDTHGDEYVLKAMNCPHHFCIYNDSPKSYKDLPLRIAENTVVYRNEKSGELSGLLRVKNLTQDDTHHFVRHDQIESEIEIIIELMERVYKIFGFTEYKVEISIRDPKHKEQYFGDDKLWNKAEQILINAVKKWGAKYSVEEGGAAFYGPKIDIQLRDSIGRYWQLTTVQMDFTQPENFNMRYTGADGEEHPVAVLHVAIFGSIERFLAILIEHYAGNFPFWLSPVQVEILPIGETHKEYSEKLTNQLKALGYRVHLDDSNETLGKKIRNWKLSKTPYALVIGDKEMESNEVSLESRDDGKIGTLSIEKLLERLKKEKEPIINK